MSYLITIEPGRSEVGITNSGDKITRDNLNNIYQTKLDFAIRNSKNGTSFPLVIASKDQSSHRDELQASEIISIDGMVASSEFPASTVENRDEESDAGVETRSCGKISELISHFKNVQATSSRPENVPHTNVPTKKLRMDFQTFVVDKPSSPTNTIDLTTTNKDLETAGKIPRGTASLPVVKLQFKIHTEEATQLHQNNTGKNKIMKQQEQFLSRNNITTKPLVKPRSFMNNQTDHNVHQQSENQSKELCNKKTSEGAQVSPVVDDSKSDHSSSDITEYKRLHWRKQHPSNVDARPKLHTSNIGNTTVNNKQESSSSKPDHCHSCSVDTVTEHPSIHSGEDSVCGSTVNDVRDNETRTESKTSDKTTYREMDFISITEKLKGKDNAAMENEITSAKFSPREEPVRPTEAANGLELLKRGEVEEHEELVPSEVTAAKSLTSDNSNDDNAPVCIAKITAAKSLTSDSSNDDDAPVCINKITVAKSLTSDSSNNNDAPVCIAKITAAKSLTSDSSNDNDAPVCIAKITAAKSLTSDSSNDDDAPVCIAKITAAKSLTSDSSNDDDAPVCIAKITAAKSLTSDSRNDDDAPVCIAKIAVSNIPSSEPGNRRFVPEIKVSFDGDGDVGLVTDRYTDSGSRAVSFVADGYTETGSRNVNERQDLASMVEDDQLSSTKYSDVSDRINDKLDLLKSELMAMRKMDLVLLRQLINISQTMQRIQRADVLRMSRSMSFLSRNMTMPRRCKPVERQNSAPHCADRKRFLFSHLRSNTEDDLRDSLSSFDESEADSAPSEVEESTNSLNSLFAANSPMTATSRQKFFQSHDLLVSLDVAEDVEQNYEDILSRNVRLWKMSFQKHQSVQEEINAWF